MNLISLAVFKQFSIEQNEKWRINWQNTPEIEFTDRKLVEFPMPRQRRSLLSPLWFLTLESIENSLKVMKKQTIRIIKEKNRIRKNKIDFIDRSISMNNESIEAECDRPKQPDQMQKRIQ